jgi:2-dehydro-3-deoxyphosphogluconate aldolase/(4S)-4-hydroxy-2-oxoglutarate aldolase
VIVIDDPELAPPLAEALLDGGINWIEITLRTGAALDCIRKIAREVPGMRVGAGTVVSGELAKKAIDAGATFGLAPGISLSAAEAFRSAGIPFIPGVCTPTDIMLAMDLGLTRLKFFPAEASGGPDFLKNANAPFLSYGIRYCPTGGLNLSNMSSYLRLPEVFTIGGSWIATREQIANREWATVTQQARDSLKAAQQT